MMGKNIFIGKWIHVDMCLPSHCATVLFIGPGLDECEVGYYSDGGWYAWQCDEEPACIDHISHWMPLPSME